MKRIAPVAALLLAAIAAVPVQAAPVFLNVTELTPGSAADFRGTLGGVGVLGTFTLASPSLVISDTSGVTYFHSIIDGTSPQYSDGSIYTPPIAATDQIGYILDENSTGAGTLTITFDSPVTDPVFHVANLDSMRYDFVPTPGATLTLLSGNGGGGDGILIAGTSIQDADPFTIVPQDPDQSPLTAGDRSAYGSVRINGTYSSLSIYLSRNPALGANLQGDGGSFTLSADVAAVPEPSTVVLALTAVGLAIPAAIHRRLRQHPA